MGQIILIENNPEQRKIINTMLDSFFGVSLIHLNTAEEAIELLEILPELPLVISSLHVNEKNAGQQIFDFIRTQGYDTQIILTGCSSFHEAGVICLSDPLNWGELVKATARILKVGFGQAKDPEGIKFIAVGLEYLNELERTPCDIFLGIGSASLETRFVKRFHAGEVLDPDRIKKYEAQGLKEFYIAGENLLYFVNFLTSQLVQKLEQQDLEIENRTVVTAKSYTLVCEIFDRLEGHGPWVELSNSCVASISNSLAEQMSSRETLKLLLSLNISPGYRHFHIVALLSHLLLLKQNWYNSEFLRTIGFVSFFTGMNTTKFLDQHPDSTDLIKTILDEMTNSPEEELHPVSKVMIVADAFVTILLNEELPSTKKEILPMLKERYTGPTYQRIIKALEARID